MHLFHSQRIIFVAALLITPLVIGCGGYQTEVVSGKVTVGNQPLAGGRVMFSPIGQGEVGPSAFAEIQPDGSYTVEEGVVVGPNRVDVLPPYKSDDEAPIERRQAAVKVAAFEAPQDLKYEVTPGATNQFDIPLTPKKRRSRSSEEEDD